MAQRGVNKVIQIGWLGEDPEIRYLPDGTAVANLTIANSDVWRDKATGEQRDKTEWHRISVIGKTAEFLGEYAKKGNQVYIEGKLRTRKWQDQSGQDRYTTYVDVRYPEGQAQILGNKQQSSQQGGWGQPQQPNNGQPHSQPQQQRVPQQQRPPQQPQYNEPPMDFDDDIPFAPIGLQYPALLNCM